MFFCFFFLERFAAIRPKLTISVIGAPCGPVTVTVSSTPQSIGRFYCEFHSRSGTVTTGAAQPPTGKPAQEGVDLTTPASQVHRANIGHGVRGTGAGVRRKSGLCGQTALRWSNRRSSRATSLRADPGPSGPSVDREAHPMWGLGRAVTTPLRPGPVSARPHAKPTRRSAHAASAIAVASRKCLQTPRNSLGHARPPWIRQATGFSRRRYRSKCLTEC